MEVAKIKGSPPKNPNLLVKYTEMGNVSEILYMSRRNDRQTIQMLKGGEQYARCDTGEIFNIKHHESRVDDVKSIRKTFAKMRALINTNVTDVKKVRWCTLTYAENMTDTKQLYSDFVLFNKRFQYYLKANNLGSAEYIVMMEPQARGAWHAHLLYIWQDRNAPYIANKVFSELWGHGFVKVKKLDNVDNVGAYLTAYLGDMEISETDADGDIKTVSCIDDNGKTVSKKIVKGARLHMYPANMQMYRCSKGVKRPSSVYLTQNVAEKKVLGATKTFETAVSLKDSETGFESVIVRTQYNRIRKCSK